MVIFGYEEQVGEFFVPNGTSPDLIKKMKTKEYPNDIYVNGCFQEDTGLVCSVYQCDSYSNLLWLNDIPFTEKLVSNINEDEFYFYLIVPFGTSNGFLGISGDNANRTQTQINWPFTNSISQRVIDDVNEGKCKIIIDQWSEGHPFDENWMIALHKLLDSVGIPRNSVHYLTQNNRFISDYNNSFSGDKIKVNQLDYCEIDIFEEYEKSFDCEIDFDKKRTKHFMSFNRNEKPHRTKFINFLEDEKLLDEGYVSYQPKELYLDTNFKKPSESEDSTGFDSVSNSQWFNSGNEYYVDSYFNIVTETFFEEPTLRFSEKIYKPIIYRQPFILYSTPFSLRQLRSVGYKTFGDFIDESYDEIQAHEKRLDALNEEVKRLCSLSLDELHNQYVKMKDILDSNFENFINVLKRTDINL